MFVYCIVFKMYLQFILDNKTKQIVSAEVLSRWDSREKGLIGPGKYIENMEHSGLISRHDFHMFELACRQLEKWKDTEYSRISLSCMDCCIQSANMGTGFYRL